jgi:hypothetical protein
VPGSIALVACCPNAIVINSLARTILVDLDGDTVALFLENQASYRHRFAAVSAACKTTTGRVRRVAFSVMLFF